MKSKRLLSHASCSSSLLLLRLLAAGTVGAAGLLCAATALAGVGGGPGFTPQPISELIIAAPQFPTDGVIVGAITLCESCDLNELTVYQADSGGLMKGTVHEFDAEQGSRHWAFEPDETLRDAAYLHCSFSG